VVPPKLILLCKTHFITRRMMRVHWITGWIPVDAYCSSLLFRVTLASPFNQFRYMALTLPATRWDP